MNLALAVLADFDAGPLGGPSQLETPLAGRGVLARTLARAAQVAGGPRRLLCTRPEHAARAAAALQAAGCPAAFELLPIDNGLRPRRELVRAARLWNPDAWRGTPLGTTWFDEFVEPLLLARLFPAVGCDGLLLIDGHQPLLDPAIAGQMLTRQVALRDEAPFLFTQAPPGLAGILLTADAVARLLDTRSIVGQLFAYQPDGPQLDVITKPMCLQVPAAVAQTPARWTADTRRSRAALEAALHDLGEDCTAEQLAAWRANQRAAGERPREVEIELTSESPLPASRLHSAALVRTGRRIVDLAAVERVARELARDDDARVVLGGHGDPLQHPQFAEACRVIRAAGVAALGVVTPLVDLPESAFEALFATPVDVVQVRIDAASAATYAEVHQSEHYPRVLANLERLLTARRERTAPRPIVIPSLTRCTATQADLEPFFDHWTRTAGQAVIEGYNEFNGRRPADGLLGLEPPVRGPCRRLVARLTLLADGSAAPCNQDVNGEWTVGDWRRDGLPVIWQDEALEAIRAANREVPVSHGLCGRCREWFRP